MDEPIQRRPEVRFHPDRRYTVAAGVGVVVAALVAVLSADGDGRLLATIAAVVLAGYVVGDLVFSPRLVASADGVVVWSPLTRASLRWDEVDDVRADVRSRFGLRSTTLEIDGGPVLAVLSRRALGTDPAAAAELVRALRPGPR